MGAFGAASQLSARRCWQQRPCREVGPRYERFFRRRPPRACATYFAPYVVV